MGSGFGARPFGVPSSEGTRTTFGQDERLDVEAAAKLARERWPGLPVVAWGTSLGAAAAVAAAGEAVVSASPPFAGMILESLYPDLDTAFRRRVALHLPGPLHLLAAGLRPALLLRSDIDPGAYRPLDELPRLAAVTLLLATGEDDRRSPPEDLARLHDVVPFAETSVVPGAAHEDLLAASPAWGEQVEAFLARW